METTKWKLLNISEHLKNLLKRSLTFHFHLVLYAGSKLDGLRSAGRNQSQTSQAITELWLYYLVKNAIEACVPR